MKLAVINFSGNVGKSTVARHLLAARIPGCQLIAVESINAQDSPSITIRGREFAQLQDALLTVPDLVVDVGASNVEELLGVMRRYKGSHADFDAFIVPTVPDRKQQQDTAATLAELARIGVPPERLRLVFNRLEEDEPVERVFETLLAYCAASGVVQPRLAACLPYNEVYARVRGTDCSLIELAADPTDYKAAIVSAGNPAEQMTMVQKLATQRLAQGVVPELDACFAGLGPRGTQRPGGPVRLSPTPLGISTAEGMMGTSTAREALIIEAIGEVARLINQVEALAPEMLKTGQALRKSDAQLHQTLAGFEARLAAITERTKTQAVQHLEAQMSASAQQMLGRLCAALIDAAHRVFQDQIGATMREQQVVLNNLRGLLHQLTQERAERWIPWATHASAAVLASMLTLLVQWLGR